MQESQKSMASMCCWGSVLRTSLASLGAQRPLKCWGPKADGGGHCRDGNAAVILEFSASEEETQGELRSRTG